MEQCKDDANFCTNCGYAKEAPIESTIYLPVRSLLKGRYAVGCRLGSDSFGVTYVGWDNTENRKVIIREYLPNEFAERVPGDENVTIFSDDKKKKQYHDGLVQFVKEGRKLCGLPENSGIVKTYDCFIFNETAYIVMESLHGMTLAQWLEKEHMILKAEDVVRMFTSIMVALQLAHSMGIIHGDISPKNIFMLNDGQLKLINFSAARFATATHSKSLIALVSEGYSPEEQYRSTGDQGAHTDVYALGAVFYRLIKGIDPPDAFERRTNLRARKKDIIEPLKGFVQVNAIMNALNVGTEDRTPDMSAFATEINSPRPVKRRGNRISPIDFGRLSARAKVAIIACAVAICTIGTLFATGVIKFGSDNQFELPPGMTVVPSVINQDIELATKLLSDAELQLSIIGKEYSPNIPAGYVLYQDLAAGSMVDINTLVQLTISGGPEMRVVPMLAGENAMEASLILEELGFIVKQEARFSQVLRAGLVISLSEEYGIELPVGSTIILYVSQGPSSALGAFITDVPDLVGLSWQEVLTIAEETGFMIEVVSREYSDTVPENHVIWQSLDAGSRQMNGTENPIELIISLGPKVSRVPDVQYKTENDAIAMLQAADLKVVIDYENSDTVNRGLVISQSPAAGKTVSTGTSIKIIVSAGAPPFSAPNVVGMTESEARSALTAVGLTVAVSYEYSQKTLGVVLSQDVSGDTLVYRGDKITIIVSSGENLKRIPSVTGMNRASAEKALVNAGFVVQVTEVYDESIAKDVIISQNPSENTSQAAGSTIYLTISLGPEPITVPNLLNISQSNADKTLRNLGLVISVSAEFNNDVSKDMVFEQNPQPGTILSKGSIVFVTVSLGSKEGTVADVTGISSESAAKILREQGFKVTIIEEFHTRSIGIVFRQDPIAGATLKEGGSVTIYVSMGIEMINVPNVVNKSEDSARLSLIDAGFKVSVKTEESATVQTGYVISQSPGAGTDAQKGSTVTLTISIGQKIIVPNVVNRNEGDAAYILQNEGLNCSVRYEDSTVAEGTVISQAPGAGTSVNSGSTVTISVSRGAFVNVPNVINRTEGEAMALLNGAGLNCSTRYEESSTVVSGSVITQSPVGGERVSVNSTVTITVSTGIPAFPMPNVGNLTQSEAEGLLRNELGLDVSTATAESETVEIGRVISQTPSSGTMVKKGDSVSITISSGVPTFSMPNVDNYVQAEAESLLRSNYGLEVIVTTAVSTSSQEGRVISQSPSAGASVRKGDSVTITVGSGPKKEAIPAHVWNSNESDAKSYLQGLGFIIESVEYANSDTVEESYIISIYLSMGRVIVSAGDLFEAGTRLILRVSLGP